MVGGEGPQPRAFNKGSLPILSPYPGLISGSALRKCPSVIPRPPQLCPRTFSQGLICNVNICFFLPRVGLQVLEFQRFLLELPVPPLLTTQGRREAAGSLNKFSQGGSSPLPLLPKEQAAPPLHPTSSGFLAQHTHSTRCSPGPTCSPRFLWCSQPGLALSSPRTFALSQPRFSLCSVLVNIDLYIQLNIDMGARSPFPTKAIQLP